MIQYVILGIALISFYLALCWISILYLGGEEKPANIDRYPSVTIAVPAYNEEEGIARTINSVLSLNYPKDKLFLIVVNDGSKDNTQQIAENAIKTHRHAILINKKQGGKASALNAALNATKSEVFGCVDADSRVDRNSLKTMIHHLQDEKTAAVISALRVDKPKNFFERLQRMEYIIAILSRKLRATINTLSCTPGVLSIYQSDVLKSLGGFDTNNITEDFEIALRLKYNGYNIRIEPKAFTYTWVPSDLKSFWRQRIRWYRGYLYNHHKYRDMFFNKQYGMMGYFQMPLNIFGIIITLTSITLITYGAIDQITEFAIRATQIKGYLASLFYIPTFNEFLLSQNLKIMIPVYAASVAGMFLFYIAHKQAKEKVMYPFTVFTYFAVYPYLVAAEWVSAISQEVAKIKRKW